MAKILTKNSVSAGSAPSGLSFGELAVNIIDKKIFIGNAVQGVVTLHDQQNVVTSVNGATGAVVLTGLTASQVLTTSSNVNATRYLTFVGGTGTTGIFIDDVTTPLSYNPQQGNIGAKKVTLTTSSNVITIDSTTPVVTLTDGANVSTFGLDSFASSNGIPFELSAAVGLTLTSSSGGIAMSGSGYYYKFPESNGTNGQALTTNGAGTLSWSTIAGLGITQTFTALQTFNAGISAPNIVTSVNGFVGAVQAVSSVNGETGSIIGVATYTGTTPFSTLQQFSQGISASAGSSFSAATVYITNSTANIDPLYVQHSSTGALKVSTTGQARSGAIKLGNSTTATNNTFISQTDGTLTLYNGISNTGSNMISFSASTIAIPTTISGATFSGLIQSTSGISANSAITGGSYLYAESGFRVGAGAINSQTGTTYTLLSTDNGEVIVWNTSSAGTLTIPSGLPVGFNATLIQTGTASIGITGSGTTLNSFEGKLRTAGQHAAVSIISYSSNVFNIAGGLT